MLSDRISKGMRDRFPDSAGGHGVDRDRMALLGLVAASFEYDVLSHTVTTCVNFGRNPLVAHPGKQSQSAVSGSLICQ